MRQLALLLVFAAGLCPAERKYELIGRIVPESQASVSLFGAATPFHTDTLATVSGRFRFRDLLPGEYVVAVFLPGVGEARRTIEVGSAAADAKGRVEITLHLEDSRVVSGEALRGSAIVSARSLSVPESARREYA